MIRPSRSNQDYGPNRELLESIIALMHGVDPGALNNALTWFPQPNKAQQARGIGMRLDCIIYTDSLKCLSYLVKHELGGSDHRPVIATLSLGNVAPGMRLTLPITNMGVDRHTYLPIEEEKLLLSEFGILALKAQGKSNLSCPKPELSPELITLGIKKFALSSNKQSVLIRVEIALGLQPHRRRLLALVDTGSTYNLIDYKFALTCVANYQAQFDPIDVPALILGDGVTFIKPLGALRSIRVDFIDSNSDDVPQVTDFIVIDSIDEKVVVGHQFFMEGHGKSSKRCLHGGEISYSKQCITFGARSVPWRYELTNATSQDTRFMECMVDTTIAHCDTRRATRLYRALGILLPLEPG